MKSRCVLSNVGHQNSEKNSTSPTTKTACSTILFSGSALLFLICKSNFSADQIIYQDPVLLFCCILTFLLFNWVKLLVFPYLLRGSKLFNRPFPSSPQPPFKAFILKLELITITKISHLDSL